MIIKFTNAQVNYLIHRPEDCIAEVLFQDFPEDNIHREAQKLNIKIEKEKKIETDDLTPIQKAILVEMVEGSTYQCAYRNHGEGNLPSGVMRTIKNAVAKLEMIDGIKNINVPYH